MIATGLNDALLPSEVDPDADKRIAISVLLDRRRRLWDSCEDIVVDGKIFIQADQKTSQELAGIRHALLTLGHRDSFCEG